MDPMNDLVGRALLLFGLDPEFPVILAVSRRGGEARSWSRPGLTIGRSPVLASWEKETGRLWVGLGRRGVAGACWGEAPREEILLPGLEAGGLEEAVDACGAALSRSPGEKCGLVLASREGAWACGAGMGEKVLEPGGAVFPFVEGDPSFQERGSGLVETAREWLVGESAENPATAAALVALGRTEVPCGKFLFVPGAPGARPFLDYSNLLKRLCGPTA